MMKNHKNVKNIKRIPHSTEYRVAENTAQRKITQGGEQHKAESNTRDFFYKGHNELRAEGGEYCVAENNTRRRITQGGE